MLRRKDPHTCPTHPPVYYCKKQSGASQVKNASSDYLGKGVDNFRGMDSGWADTDKKSNITQKK